MLALIVDLRGGVAPQEIAAMGTAFRGSPNPATTWSDGHAAVATANARLLPEDVFDRQPFVTDDLLFAAQARIDNRDEVLAQLNVLITHRAEISDTEVLYRAYRRWGEECVQELTGDYAFAALHRESGKVVAAVDHIGSARLYYATVGEKLLISTQLGALLAHRDAPRALNIVALGHLIAPKTDSNSTSFQHIRVLPGGQMLHWDGSTARMRNWWRPDVTIRKRYRDSRDYVAHAKEVFDRAVTACLRAGGGVAATISGGLDSTLVATAAAVRLDAQGREITAYTSIPEPGLACRVLPNWEADDWPYAQAVAAVHRNMNHIAVSPGGQCTLDILPDIHRRSRTPLRNGFNHIWLGRIADQSREAGARVILTGSKGNATVSYSGEGALRDMFGRWQWAAAFKLARQARGDWRRAGYFVARELAGQKARNFFNRLRGRRNDGTRPGMIYFTSAFKEAQAASLADRLPELIYRGRMLLFMTSPIRAWIADAMAQWGVEFRDPTADRRLIECLISFPREAFLAGGRERGLARAMGEGLMPDSVRLRTTRGLQGPELESMIAAHRRTYCDALDRAAQVPLYRAIVDVDQVRASIDRVSEGRSALFEAVNLERALDVGMFMTGEAG